MPAEIKVIYIELIEKWKTKKKKIKTLKSGTGLRPPQGSLLVGFPPPAFPVLQLANPIHHFNGQEIPDKEVYCSKQPHSGFTPHCAAL